MTNGASNDIERATGTRAMVTQYGMSDKLGMVTCSAAKPLPWRRIILTCSVKTAEEIDEEVRRIVVPQLP